MIAEVSRMIVDGKLTFGILIDVEEGKQFIPCHDLLWATKRQDNLKNMSLMPRRVEIKFLNVEPMEDKELDDGVDE